MDTRQGCLCAYGAELFRAPSQTPNGAVTREKGLDTFSRLPADVKHLAFTDYQYNFPAFQSTGPISIVDEELESNRSKCDCAHIFQSCPEAFAGHITWRRCQDSRAWHCPFDNTQHILTSLTGFMCPTYTELYIACATASLCFCIALHSPRRRCSCVLGTADSDDARNST